MTRKQRRARRSAIMLSHAGWLGFTCADWAPLEKELAELGR